MHQFNSLCCVCFQCLCDGQRRSWSFLWKVKLPSDASPAVSHSVQTSDNHTSSQGSDFTHFYFRNEGNGVYQWKTPVLSLNWRQRAMVICRKNKFSPPPPQSFRCGSKQPYTLSHPEAWVAPFMTHDWNPSNVTDSAGQRSQSNKRNALTRLLE